MRYFDGDDALLGGDLANDKSQQLKQALDIDAAPVSREGDADEKAAAEPVEKAAV